MKIDILQFIKKLNLAISLAEHNSLFVVSGLKSFALPARLAALFRIPSDATRRQSGCHLFSTLKTILFFMPHLMK